MSTEQRSLSGHEDVLDNLAVELRFQSDELRRLRFWEWAGDVEQVAREIEIWLKDNR